LAFLDRSVLIASDPAADVGDQANQIVVMAQSAADVTALVEAIRSAIHALAPQFASVQAPRALIDLRRVVDEELQTNTRGLLLVELPIGLIVIAITLFGGVSIRRRDFGRRRALGATRSAIVLLVICQAVVAAAIGAALGGLLGLILVARLAGALPSVTFMLAVGVLAVLVAVVGAVPPGLVVALRDPVRVLRVA
jgi:putative ABC transport system permease protein